jgi:Restriction endonuclease
MSSETPRTATKEWKRRRREALARDGHRCRDCGTSGSPLEVHHLTPVAAGGTDELENLRTLCTECHRVRHKQGRGPPPALEKKVPDKGAVEYTVTAAPEAQAELDEPALNRQVLVDLLLYAAETGRPVSDYYLQDEEGIECVLLREKALIARRREKRQEYGVMAVVEEEDLYVRHSPT